MKQELILFLGVVCAFTAAMAPRERREAKPDGEGGIKCAETTPCAWINYDERTRREHPIIYNKYCTCPDHLACVPNEDDLQVHTYVHRCRPPSDTILEEHD